MFCMIWFFLIHHDVSSGSLYLALSDLQYNFFHILRILHYTLVALYIDSCWFPFNILCCIELLTLCAAEDCILTVKVVPVPNQLSTTPWRCIREWMYRSMYSWPCTSWGWVVSVTPWPLYLGERTPWYPLVRRQGGPQNQPGWCGTEKNLAPTRTWTPTPQRSSP
jgi:hypothetical protein